MLPRLCLVAGALVELAEAEVAVGDERAHAEFGGQRERLTVVPFGVYEMLQREVRRTLETLGVAA
jgi:hypothetical protein